MELLDDAFLVPELVLVGAWILVPHAKAHGSVEEDGDLARRGPADARRQSSVEGSQRGTGLAPRHAIVVQAPVGRGGDDALHAHTLAA